MSTKNNNTCNNTEKIDTESWKDFGLDVLRAFISVLIIGFLGANFVFFTRVNLDIFFPTEVDQRPYTDENKVGNKLPPLCPEKKSEIEMGSMKGGRKKKQTGGAKGTGCGDIINICESKIFENKYFKGMFDYGFPYTMESKEDTFGGIITSWFANKVKYSYIWLRIVLKTIIEFFASFCEMLPDSAKDAKDVIPFIVAPVGLCILLAISGLWYIPSLVSVFWNENSDWGMIISIIGLFFGWTWMVPLFTSFVQIFGLMFKLMLFPILLNPMELINIMGHKWNKWYMKILFFGQCIWSAFQNFDTLPAIVMTVIFLINMIPTNDSSV